MAGFQIVLIDVRKPAVGAWEDASVNEEWYMTWDFRRRVGHAESL